MEQTGLWGNSAAARGYTPELQRSDGGAMTRPAPPRRAACLGLVAEGLADLALRRVLLHLNEKGVRLSLVHPLFHTTFDGQ